MFLWRSQFIFRSSVLRHYANILEDYTLPSFRKMEDVPLKHMYPLNRLQCVIIQKTTVWISQFCSALLPWFSHQQKCLSWQTVETQKVLQGAVHINVLFLCALITEIHKHGTFYTTGNSRYKVSVFTHFHINSKILSNWMQ